MRVRVLGLVAVLTLTWVAIADAQSQLGLSVYVVSDSGPVTTLAPEDVRVLENDVELTVTKVEAVDGTPRVQILLDNGAGIGGDNIQYLREGLTNLLTALPEGVEVAVYTTAPQPRPLLQPTTDRARIMKAPGMLAPDTGVGRFADAINESAQRLVSKPGGVSTVIAVATTSGDADVLPRTLKEIQTRIQKLQPVVHVVLFSRSNASGGTAQTEIAANLTKATGGRFETIVAATALPALMANIGADVGKTTAGKGGMFKITAQRASGAPKQLGRISFGSTKGQATRVTID